MTSCERVLRVLRHQEADRIPISDSPWTTTTARWHREGLPESVGPDVYFNYEFSGQIADTSFQLPSHVVEETDDYVVEKNSNGATRKNWKSATSTPECIGFTITTRDCWEEHKHRLTYNRSRVDWDGGLKANHSDVMAGKFVTYSSPFGYDWAQGVIGSETLLATMALEPDWNKELLRTHAELVINSAEEMMSRGFHFDGAFLFDDNGYRNATLFSPRMYDDLIWPVHKRVCDFFNARKIPVILHTCGNVNALIPGYIAAGFACIQPLEVKAGMDLIRLKKEYGDRLSFMGGIDVRKMALEDPAAIEEEIRTKITAAKIGGGYIYHSDHSVPDNVSFEQYKRVMALVARYGSYK